MRVIIVLFLVAISLQKITSANSLSDPRFGKSSISTEYEARFKQFRNGLGPNEANIAGQQKIERETNEESWESFAAKCAEVIKSLVSTLANAISSSPGDSTDLQLDIKNRIFHHDDRKFNTCKPVAFLPTGTEVDDNSSVAPVIEVTNSPTISFPSETDDCGRGCPDEQGIGNGHDATHGLHPNGSKAPIRPDDREYMPVIQKDHDNDVPTSIEGHYPAPGYGSAEGYVPDAGRGPFDDTRSKYDHKAIYAPVGGNDVYGPTEGHRPDSGYGPTEGYVPPAGRGPFDDTRSKYDNVGYPHVGGNDVYDPNEGYHPDSGYGPTEGYVPPAGRSPFDDTRSKYNNAGYAPVGGNDGYGPTEGYVPGNRYDVTKGYVSPDDFGDGNDAFLNNGGYGPQDRYPIGNGYETPKAYVSDNSPKDDYPGGSDKKYNHYEYPNNNNASSDGYPYDNSNDLPNRFDPENALGPSRAYISDNGIEPSAASAPLDSYTAQDRKPSMKSPEAEFMPTEDYPPSEPTMNTPATQEVAYEPSYPVTPSDQNSESTKRPPEDPLYSHPGYNPLEPEIDGLSQPEDPWYSPPGYNPLEPEIDGLSQPVSTDALPINNWKPSNGYQEPGLLPKDATITDDGSLTSPNLSPAVPSDSLGMPASSGSPAPFESDNYPSADQNTYDIANPEKTYKYYSKPDVSEPVVYENFGPEETVPLPATSTEPPVVNVVKPEESFTPSQPSTEYIEPSGTALYPTYEPKPHVIYDAHSTKSYPPPSDNQLSSCEGQDYPESTVGSEPNSPHAEDTVSAPSVHDQSKQAPNMTGVYQTIFQPSDGSYNPEMNGYEPGNLNNTDSDGNGGDNVPGAGKPAQDPTNLTYMNPSVQHPSDDNYASSPSLVPNRNTHKYTFKSPSSDTYVPADSYETPANSLARDGGSQPEPSTPIYIPIGKREPATDPRSKPTYDSEQEDSCSCDDCCYDDIVDHKAFCQTACKDLEQARDELKAIFDKIKKKLKCTQKVKYQTS